MKKCGVCGKPEENLKETLLMGPAGFRRYQACKNCQRKAEPKRTLNAQPKAEAKQ
jgi:hypothetical protein